MQTVYYCCPILIENVILQKILVELPNSNFYENLFTGSVCVMCGQINSDDEANGLIFASLLWTYQKLAKKNKGTQTFY
jgi:hypothetical protein